MTVPSKACSASREYGILFIAVLLSSSAIVNAPEKFDHASTISFSSAEIP